MSAIKCIIAAGGLGTRLQGFRGNESTKILLKVNSKPMIVQQLEQLISWGLEEFIIITNPSFDSLIKHETSEMSKKYSIEFAIQSEQIGISHALKQAISKVNDDDQVVFVLGDNFFGINPMQNINFEELVNSNKNSIIFTKEVPVQLAVSVLTDCFTWRSLPPPNPVAVPEQVAFPGRVTLPSEANVIPSALADELRTASTIIRDIVYPPMVLGI